MTTRTSGFLMANLGSEVIRLFLAREAGDSVVIAQCRDRALRITKALKNHPALKDRAGEVMLLEFLVEDAAAPEQLFDIRRDDLEAYFTPFAMRALRQA